MLVDRLAIGTVPTSRFGALDVFTLSSLGTADITGTSTFAGNYGIYGLGTVFDTDMNTTRQTHLHATMAPFTTGVATIMGGNYGTALSLSGSHQLHPTNLTGTISLVRPLVRHRFRRDLTGAYQGNVSTSAVMESVTVTFVPEPAPEPLARFLALGLAAVAGLRRLTRTTAARRA